MKRMVIVILFGVVTLASALLASAQSETSGLAVRSTEAMWRGVDFADGEGENVVITADGVTVSHSAGFASYISPVMAAPDPFNVLVPRWQIRLSQGTLFDLLIRTRGASDTWTDWISVPPSEDMEGTNSWTHGDLLSVPATTATHYQFRLVFNTNDASSSSHLTSLAFTFIDSTAGPSAADMQALLADGEVRGTEGGDYPKPPVVGRDIWCVDPRCNYDPAGLTYSPVTHLIVHHTVTSNSASDWAAIVRAIWYYHTVTLDWQDVGYNYLVDPDGIIYEGHAGGDDVVGIHAGSANTGSMGVALLGNFIQEPPGIDPPAAMLNSAAELLAWKADQRGIDIFDSSYLPNMGWGLPHLMGHRDVYGTTQCPGERMHVLLPALRDEVAQRLGFQPEPIYYDELAPETHFVPGGAGFNVGPFGCGFDRQAYYAWTTQDPAQVSHWAEWHPEVATDGVYELSAYAPYCNTGRGDTGGAVYAVTHASGTDSVVIDQEANLGIWTPLGAFPFIAGTGGAVYLNNLTSTDSELGIWFDALRMHYLVPEAIPLIPVEGSWWNERAITFDWSIEYPESLAQQYLRVATDPDFANVVYQSEWFSAETRSAATTFAGDYEVLYWQVVLVDTRGDTISQPWSSFGIDTEPPVSSMIDVFRLAGGDYFLTWQASDTLSGVAAHTIEYRAAQSQEWTTLVNGTPAVSGYFVPPDPGQTYWFRSRATDVAGNQEPLHPGEGDLSTEQAIQLSHAIMLPATLRH